MKNSLFCALVALIIPFGFTSLAHAQAPGVRDAANMFSADAQKQSTAQLEHIYKSDGWPIVIETIESLNGKSVDDLARDGASSLRIRGLYVLLASKEHRISIEVHKSASKVFDSKVRESLKQTITSAFKENKYDQGLLDGVAYLGKVAAEHPAAPDGNRVARQQEGVPAAAEQRGRGSFLMTALVVGGIVLLALFVIRLVAGASRAGAGGVGAPGGGGGGFLSSLFGAVGGVFLGNWLYNTFSGGHAHASDADRHSPDSSNNSGASDEYESTSGGWDSGDDAGGFDGGDFGGGDGGGGDW